MYCERGDLLIGDLPLPANMAEGFIQAAVDEIDSVLGVNYILPIDTALADPTADLTLKRIAVLLASGRLIMAQATGSEDEGVHAYGMYLLREGKDLLCKVESGALPLIGVTKREEYADTGNTPYIKQEDSVSPIDAYYSTVSRGIFKRFVPGDLNDEVAS